MQKKLDTVSKYWGKAKAAQITYSQFDRRAWHRLRARIHRPCRHGWATEAEQILKYRSELQANAQRKQISLHAAG